jgi:hypothetical protein
MNETKANGCVDHVHLIIGNFETKEFIKTLLPDIEPKFSSHLEGWDFCVSDTRLLRYFNEIETEVTGDDEPLCNPDDPIFGLALSKHLDEYDERFFEFENDEAFFEWLKELYDVLKTLCNPKENTN